MRKPVATLDPAAPLSEPPRVLHHRFDFGESWMTKNWRPLAAMVYLTICMTDFVFMPIYYEWANSHVTPEATVMLALKFEGVEQIEGLRILHTERAWQPLTLSESGLFHVAFGAILGVAAWSRSTTKQNQYAAAVATVHESVDSPKP